MEITRVSVVLNGNKPNGEARHKNGRILGFAEVTLDSCIVITGIRIIRSSDQCS